ncbi:ABC transporter substrate-binding protein [Curvibacter sp. APW13]|uniref:ABC transporter substrate-binding protein n=1 Tax=Curvibacter sp. APW13 TaxID=3077236 RepID=UPI0028DDBC5C|nr:ABC transporter substrate-binding protein [Curvibacter sp. APW13]MDT8991296.1 ABC transporter substrate-binding protein [Curvibacter sp. APW13]
MKALVRLLCVGVALLLTFSLTGCDRPTEPFRVGTNVWIGYEPLYLAQDLGLYGNAPVRMVTLPNATEAQQALRAGVVEAAALTLDEALTMKQDGLDLRVIAVMDTSHGADVLLAKPTLRSLEQLKGKRVGVESTATGVLMLHEALAAVKLGVKDIDMVYLTVDQHEAAFREGRIDALVTFEPVRTQLLAQGAHVLFDSSRIPGRIVDVLVTTGANSSRYADTLRQLLLGHFQALERLQADPLKAAVHMTARQGLRAEQVVASFQGVRIPSVQDSREMLTGAPSPLQRSAQQLQDVMLAHKMLAKPSVLDGMFDPSLLPP